MHNRPRAHRLSRPIIVPARRSMPASMPRCRRKASLVNKSIPSGCSFLGKISPARTEPGPSATTSATCCATLVARKKPASTKASMRRSGVSTLSNNRLTVQLKDGTEQTYDARRQQGVSVYREQERAFSTGDRVQFTAPGPGSEDCQSRTRNSDEHR